ncbi:oligosaccharyltransferase complex subunit ostc isoform 2-T2 [Tautogolabrus adspersus]
METLYSMPFTVLECPNVKLKKPSWLHMPSAMTVYAAVIVSYFLITGGIIYDVIVEPPSVGSMTDEHGHQRPVAFLAYRVNGQKGKDRKLTDCIIKHTHLHYTIGAVNTFCTVINTPIHHL